MNENGFFGSVNLLQAEHDETLVGDEFEILPHIGDRQARKRRRSRMSSANCISHSTASSSISTIWRSSCSSKSSGLLVADFLNDLESKIHVGRFVAKDPVRARREAVKQSL